MTDYPRALACGDSGVSIEFGDRIDEDINARVLALDRALASNLPAGLIETVPTYRALMIHYDPVATTFDAVSEAALALAGSAALSSAVERRLTIPVCYDGEFGTDLVDVARALGLAAGDVVDIHAGGDYRVYMLGFQPGFAYLGGLDPRLTLPRRPSPRSGAKAGTISIAAGQCAVHSIDGPSGWHWIGRTPFETYRPGPEPMFAIEPGDRIRFRPVSPARWHELKRAAGAGENIVEVDSPCHA